MSAGPAAAGDWETRRGVVLTSWSMRAAAGRALPIPAPQANHSRPRTIILGRYWQRLYGSAILIDHIYVVYSDRALNNRVRVHRSSTEAMGEGDFRSDKKGNTP